MNIELITPEHPAKTFGSVTEPDLKLAMYEAERLVRNDPAMRGVVLHRPKQSLPAGFFNWASLNDSAYFSNNSREELGIESRRMPVLVKDTSITPGSAGASVYNVMGLHNYDKPHFIDPLREADLSVLSTMFSCIYGYVCIEAKNRIYAHYDVRGYSIPLTETEAEECLFDGKEVRWLVAREGPGAIVADSDEDVFRLNGTISIPKIGFREGAVLRQVATDDALLLFDEAWAERAAPHSSPDFNAEVAGFERVLDNYSLAVPRKRLESLFAPPYTRALAPEPEKKTSWLKRTLG